jgi:hypothetical protein
MMTLSAGTRDLVCALFAYEFADGQIDEASIDEIRAGGVGEWIEAIESSALFGSADLLRIRTVFENDPEQLVGLLVDSVDELRVRRRKAAQNGSSWIGRSGIRTAHQATG